jgi:hypothetical protein
MPKEERTATLADLEKILGEPIPAPVDTPALTVEQAQPVATFGDLLAAVESLTEVEYRVIGGKRFGFLRFRASDDWVNLIRRSQRGKEFTESSARGFLVNPGETDKEKQLWVKNGDVTAQAMIVFGTLAEPKPAKLEEVFMLALKGGWLFTALVNAALETNGERAIEAAKKG